MPRHTYGDRAHITTQRTTLATSNGELPPAPSGPSCQRVAQRSPLLPAGTLIHISHSIALAYHTTLTLTVVLSYPVATAAQLRLLPGQVLYTPGTDAMYIRP